MVTPTEDGHGRGRFMNRRQLLWVAGGAGIAAAASVYAKQLDAGVPVAEGTTSRAASVKPAPPAPAPEPVVTPAPIAASAAVICRDAWGARESLPGGVRHTITRMTLHHTAAVLGDNRNAPGRLRQHQRLHQDERGWVDIAYHVGIDRNGNIYELRNTDFAGDTATEYNPAGHFLVLCEGDFDQEAVSEEQLHSAAMAFAWAAQTFEVSADSLGSHRDFAATACPGADLYAHVESGDLRRRIDALLAAGTVDLHRVCGPEASEIVAAVEAGAPA
ncbi:N-acetylmuramoyl-L-alanine amidase [Mycolicibacterium poriferae]|nr:N-acetylmuramoyl-L-alanine amidase [Mycolicibacterium poriferae]